jgi:predicted DNA-binding protein
MSRNPKTSPWYSTPRTARTRRGVELTLSNEAHERLDRLAKVYGGKSAAVERLIMEAKLPP